MLLGFKTEIKVKSHQRILLAKHAGVARHAWNWGLDLTKKILDNNQDKPEDLKDTAAPSGGNGGSNKTGLTSDTNSSITESPHPGAAQASEFGQIDSVSRNHTQRQINLVEPLQFNLETFVEKNSPDPGISIKLKKIEPKFGQIDSDFTDINVGSVDIKADAVKSKLDIDSQDLETELTLLSQSGFKLKMIGEFQNSDRKLKIGPVVSFKKSLNWLQEQSQTEAEDKKVSLQQANRSAVLRRLTLNSAYFNSLRINQGNEIDDSSKDIQTLTKSLNSLTISEFATNTTFSFEGDLEELSAKLEFPVPGILRDELELKIKTNLPEVLVDGEDGQENMKSTLSLRYRIGINDAIKLEIESSYNLRITTTSYKIMFKLF